MLILFHFEKEQVYSKTYLNLFNIFRKKTLLENIMDSIKNLRNNFRFNLKLKYINIESIYPKYILRSKFI